MPGVSVTPTRGAPGPRSAAIVAHLLHNLTRGGLGAVFG